jgi:hypothetical protein
MKRFFINILEPFCWKTIECINIYRIGDYCQFKYLEKNKLTNEFRVRIEPGRIVYK